MADAAIQLRTGDDAFPYRVNAPVAERFARVALPYDVRFPLALHGLWYPTGQDTMAGVRAATVRNWFALLDVGQGSTGYGWITAPILRAYVTEGDVLDLDETDEPLTAPTELAQEQRPNLELIHTSKRSPEAVAASRLRELSGLQAEKLAEIFGVTRTTFYNWLKGARPRGTHRDRLLHVVQLLEEAARVLGGARDVSAWLITPSAASRRIPVELLKQEQYDLCRSLLTRSRTVRPVLPQRTTRRRLAGSQLRDALERISSSPALEDYEDTASEK
jgi:DNA-binding transcriptional regulator YiaG